MSGRGARPYRRRIDSIAVTEAPMHPHPEIHRAIARDTQARRIAAARAASVGAGRARRATTTATAPGILARMAALLQRRPAGEAS